MIMTPIIAVDDTVTVDGLPGRWIVCTIHLGNAEQLRSSRDHSYVTVSQTRSQDHGRSITTTIETVTDPRKLHFVRPRNVDMDAAGLDPRPCDYVIDNGVIRNVHDLRAALRP
ncbi:hypothetical protein [Amycolatopsis anabasis]|uniref:hypothetical protein n=1 Tax=Amycolatopsis anabasis TaxID=1840409 RepID=UPI00131C421B|nr:hypothetical protein [Amycolatopsis anabasis]